MASYAFTAPSFLSRSSFAYARPLSASLSPRIPTVLPLAKNAAHFCTGVAPKGAFDEANDELHSIGTNASSKIATPLDIDASATISDDSDTTLTSIAASASNFPGEFDEALIVDDITDLSSISSSPISTTPEPKLCLLYTSDAADD